MGRGLIVCFQVLVGRGKGKGKKAKMNSNTDSWIAEWMVGWVDNPLLIPKQNNNPIITIILSMTQPNYTNYMTTLTEGI